MTTVTPTPEEMEKRVVRFKTVQPKKRRTEKESGIPAKALESIAADTIYLYMAPKVDSGSNQNPGILGLPGLTVNVCRCPPGQGPNLHSHERTIETFMTLQGEFKCQWGDEGEHNITLGLFDMVSFPKNVMRRFENTSQEDSLLLVLIQGENNDLANDIQYSPEIGEKITAEFGADVRKRIEEMGWRFDANTVG